MSVCLIKAQHAFAKESKVGKHISLPSTLQLLTKLWVFIGCPIKCCFYEATVAAARPLYFYAIVFVLWPQCCICA